MEQNDPEAYRKRETAMIEKIIDRFSFVRLFELIDLVYKQGEHVSELQQNDKKWQEKLRHQQKVIDVQDEKIRRLENALKKLIPEDKHEEMLGTSMHIDSEGEDVM